MASFILGQELRKRRMANLRRFTSRMNKINNTKILPFKSILGEKNSVKAACRAKDKGGMLPCKLCNTAGKSRVTPHATPPRLTMCSPPTGGDNPYNHKYPSTAEHLRVFRMPGSEEFLARFRVTCRNEKLVEAMKISARYTCCMEAVHILGAEKSQNPVKKKRKTATSGTVETRSEPVPATSGTVETRSEPVPATSGTVETRSEPVPATSGTVETRSEPVPATTGTVETRSEPNRV